MKSFDETEEYDRKELARLNAEPWMVEQLKLNPDYTSWGPGEDFMKVACKDDSGEIGDWDSGVAFSSWGDFHWVLDEYNECVNYYFEIQRASVVCKTCGQTGYNPKTRVLSETFHGGWDKRLTEDELEALRENGRDFESPFGHDAINRGILVEVRAKRFGVYGLCPHCEGHGYVFTETKAKLALVLWMIHPRKGASRGIVVEEVQENQLPAVRDYLRKAARRNADRFSKLDGY